MCWGSFWIGVAGAIGAIVLAGLAAACYIGNYDERQEKTR